MYRVIVLVLLVAGLMLVVGDIFAERPPIHDCRIPIYLGDPDDPYMRPRGDQEAVQANASLQTSDLRFRILRDFGEGLARRANLVEVRILGSPGANARDKCERKP